MASSAKLFVPDSPASAFLCRKPLAKSAVCTTIKLCQSCSITFAPSERSVRWNLLLHTDKACVSFRPSTQNTVFPSLHCLPTDEERILHSSEILPILTESTQLSDIGSSGMSGLLEQGNIFVEESECGGHSSGFNITEDEMTDGSTLTEDDTEDKFPAGDARVRQRKKNKVRALLQEEKHPVEVLKSLPEWGSLEFWTVVDYLAAEKRLGEALQVFAWWRRLETYVPCEKHFVRFIKMLGIAKRPDISLLIFNEMLALGLKAGLASYTALLDSYAEAGCFDQAETLARKLSEFDIQPNAATFYGLLIAYFKQGNLDKMNRLFNDMKRWGYTPDHRTYKCMIVAYGKAGLFRHMERAWKQMDDNGWKLDFPIINAILQSYAVHGHFKEMHSSYLRIHDYRDLVSKGTVRAMASLYIQNSKFYLMRVFVKDVGLTRKDFGSLLWNLLLVAFAASFQAKNLQRSWLGMEIAGFAPNLTTYNICALCYSRMKMMWELHAMLIKMRKAGVVPDLVTFSAVVDSYIAGRERFQKMFMELDELRLKNTCPSASTDPLVLQAFGKGEFHSFSETLMQANPQPYGKCWTYGLLLSFYLKKRGARRNIHNLCDQQGSRFVAKQFFIKMKNKQDVAS